MKPTEPHPRECGEVLVPGADAVPGAWYALATIVGVTFVALIDRQLLIVSAAPIMEALELSNAQLGIIQGLSIVVFAAIAAYPIAWAADRYDRRFILAGCLLLWTIGAVGCGLSRNFGQLFLAAVAIAAGEAGLAPITIAAIPDLFRGRSRNLANAVYYSVAYAGVSLALAISGSGVALAGILQPVLPGNFQALEPWRLAFLIAAAPSPLLLVMIAFSRLGSSSSRLEAGKHRSGGLLELLLRHSGTMAIVLCGLGFYLLPFSELFVWIPVIAGREFHLNTSQIGIAMGGCFAAGTSVGVLTSTYLLGRLRRASTRAPLRIAATFATLIGPLVMLVPLARSAATLFALYAVIMAAGSGIGVLVPTILQEMAPPRLRARLVALFTIVATVLSGFGPMAVGLLSDELAGRASLLAATAIIGVPASIIATLCLLTSASGYNELVGEAIAAENIVP